MGYLLPGGSQRREHTIPQRDPCSPDVQGNNNAGHGPTEHSIRLSRSMVQRTSGWALNLAAILPPNTLQPRSRMWELEQRLPPVAGWHNTEAAYELTALLGLLPDGGRALV